MQVRSLIPAACFALTSLAVQSCGESSGGKDQSSGTSTATSTSSANGAATASPTPSPTPSAASIGTGGDPTDAQLCAFLTAQPAATMAHFSGAMAYLCSQNGFAALRQAAGQIQTLQNTTDSGGISHFELAGAISAKGKTIAMQKLNTLYCSNFDQYKTMIGAGALSGIQSVTPSNVTASGCDYDLKLTPILIIQPEYIGTQQFLFNSDQTAGLSFNYLTRAVSDVNDSTTLSIVASYQGGIFSYTVLTSASNTEGFASTVLQQLQTSSKASIQGFANALVSLSN